MSSSVLTSRDVNSQPANQTAEDKPKSMDYHRQVLESKMKGGLTQPTYTSPSDNIMSPASKKLSAFRSKQAMKNVKPQTLFAKTSTRNMQNAANGAALFGNTQKENTTQ